MTRREWLAMGGLALLPGCGARGVVRNFTPSNEEFGNPERGFYVQRAAEDPGELRALRSRGVSLVLLTLDLKNHRARPLDDAKMSVLDDSMHRIRKAGLKVIFRAAYGFTDADYRVDPSDLTLIQRHIAAISKCLTNHAPWVFAVQAGMLGPWGEWHGSNHGNPPSLEARTAVVKSWLDRLPAEIFVQVRRPMFLRDMGVDLKRTGFHNDALLALPDDMGTYSEPGWDRSRELKWCAESLKSVPFGGETVPDSEATPPAQVLTELETLGATFLNSGYHQGTLDQWKRSKLEGGTLYDIVNRRLGYRLTAMRSEIQGGHIKLHLRNDGFGPPLKPRRVSFAWYDPKLQKIVGGSSTKTHNWMPGSGELVLSSPLQTVAGHPGLIPAIRLADHSDALANDARHSIRLYGYGLRFDQDGGWNILG